MSTPFYYMRPDELWQPIVTGDVAPDHLASWLCDLRAGRPVRAPEAEDLDLALAGAATSCNGAVLAHSNLSVAGVLSGDVSLSLTPTVNPDNIRLNPMGLFNAVSVDAVGFDVVGNPEDAIVGELFLGTVRQLPRNLQRLQNRWAVRTFSIRPRAEFGSMLPYKRGLEGRRLAGSNLYSPTEFADILDWFRSCKGGSLPTIIAPDSLDDAWVVDFVSLEWRLVPISTGETWVEAVFLFDEYPRPEW